MQFFLGWYLATTFLGILAFPLAYRLLPGLFERGMAFSRTLGVLLCSYLFWILGSLGLAQNTSGGILLAGALLAGLSLWALMGIRKNELRSWLRQHLGALLVSEVLFLAAFAFLAVVRAANPEALGTEKPMELAFINAILRSPGFPPNDPWLSGYSISYYYFGYVITAMLARLTGTPGGLAFNLGLALTFALSASGAYGLVLDLYAAFRSRTQRSAPNPLAALLGPLFLLLVSNLEGFLQMLHQRGLFWSKAADGTLKSSFWSWLDILDLNTPPPQPLSWVPDRFWWWWRASRVVQDYDLIGKPREIIDEFPFFSYLLGDLHPHVLAMPFAFLAMALALNLFLASDQTRLRWQGRLSWRPLAWLCLAGIPISIALLTAGLAQLRISLAVVGGLALATALYGLLHLAAPIREHGLRLLTRAGLGEIQLGFELRLNPAGFILAAITLGGLAFLNTWDFPIYVALAAGAYALRGLLTHQRTPEKAFFDFIGLGLALGLAGVLLYFPFYLGFSSQAGGILPNLIYPTRGAQLWVMFGSLILPILAWQLYLLRRSGGRALWKGLQIAAGLMLLLWLAALLLGFLISLMPALGDFYMSSLGAFQVSDLLGDAITRRFTSAGGWITLLALLSLGVGLLLHEVWPGKDTSGAEQPAGLAPSGEDQAAEANLPDSADTAETRSLSADVFVLLLAITGTLLVITPEFFYLRDLFGWRMNTIFKFYYQAWLIWSAAAAYASLILLASLKGLSRGIFTVCLGLLLIAALAYPALSLPNKTNNFQPSVWTLDASDYYARANPDEMAAIQWLQNAPLGTVAEAVPATGGSYTEFARAATFSGQPGVLGWVGHENQWRGDSGAKAINPRQGELETLFCSRDWPETQAILESYHIRYVFVGGLERQTYSPTSGSCPVGLSENKFMRNLSPVFQQGGVTIYEYQVQSEQP